MKKIQRIVQLKNVIIDNHKTDTSYVSKNGVILVEFNDNKIYVLDLDLQRDITHDKDIDVYMIKRLFFGTKLIDLFKKEGY